MPETRPSVETLRQAIAAGAIAPYFQPIVEIESGRLRGFEVLARWLHEGLPPVLPEGFIGLARAEGLLSALTLQVVRKACAAARGWPGDFYLAFNLPPVLLQDTDAMEDFLATAEASGLPLHRIRVEMTEEEVVEHEAAAESAISQLRRLGIKAMLDDFGTGYSSLVRLHRFAFEKIKIDGSFIRGLETDEASRKIVSAIVGLGQSLGATVVAECVETPFQLQFLAAVGCDAYQGWLLARAMDAATAARWLEAYRPSGTVISALRLSPYQRQYQLEALYEHASVGLAFIDTGLRFIAANATFCRMHRRTQATVVGRPFTDVVPVELHGIATELILRTIQDGSSDIREIPMPGREETFLFSHDRVCDAAGTVLGISVVCINVPQKGDGGG